MHVLHRNIILKLRTKFFNRLIRRFNHSNSRTSEFKENNDVRRIRNIGILAHIDAGGL